MKPKQMPCRFTRPEDEAAIERVRYASQHDVVKVVSDQELGGIMKMRKRARSVDTSVTSGMTKLTPWFDCYTHPKRIGVYEVSIFSQDDQNVYNLNTSVEFYSYYDGEYWYSAAQHKEIAILNKKKSIFQYMYWRGLKSKSE